MTIGFFDLIRDREIVAWDTGLRIVIVWNGDTRLEAFDVDGCRCGGEWFELKDKWEIADNPDRSVRDGLALISATDFLTNELKIRKR